MTSPQPSALDPRSVIDGYSGSRARACSSPHGCCKAAAERGGCRPAHEPRTLNPVKHAKHGSETCSPGHLPAKPFIKARTSEPRFQTPPRPQLISHYGHCEAPMRSSTGTALAEHFPKLSFDTRNQYCHCKWNHQRECKSQRHSQCPRHCPCPRGCRRYCHGPCDCHGVRHGHCQYHWHCQCCQWHWHCHCDCLCHCYFMGCQRHCHCLDHHGTASITVGAVVSATVAVIATV